MARIRLAERLGLVWKQAEFTAPRTPVEERLAVIWASVLGIASVGIHDNFFQSGGDSLTATQVIARICHEFRVELPIESLFASPTVAGLAVLLSQAISRPQVPVNAGASTTQRRGWPFPTFLCPGTAVVSRSDTGRQPRLQRMYLAMAHRQTLRGRHRAEPQ